MRFVSRNFILMTMLLSTLVMGVSAAQPAQSTPAAGTGSLLAPSVALAPDGTPWAAWVVDSGSSRRIAAGRWDGQAWHQLAGLDALPGGWDAAPSLAFDAEGVAWLAWSASTGTDDSLYLSRWAGRAWSPARELPFQATVPNRQPVLAPAPGGGLWLAWVGFDGNDDEIYAAFWDGAGWSQPQRVSSDDADPAAYDTQPRLAVGSDGTAWLAWTSYEKFLDDEIYAARWDGSRWLAEQQVSADDDSVDAYPSLAVAGDGSAWLAWQAPVDGPAGPHYRIRAAQWAPAEGWTGETMISSPAASDVDEEQPSLALDAQGRPNVVWLVDGGQRGVGRAVYDGGAWAAPRWAVTGDVGGGVGLLSADPGLLLWSVDASPAGVPLQPQRLDDAEPRLPLVAPPEQSLSVQDVVINRHMAFGDSITWGLYDDPETGQLVGDYPARLDVMLDTRVVPSEVMNAGKPGEQTPEGKFRLKDLWPSIRPQFVEIMEGTNDITAGRPYNDITFNLAIMIGDSKDFGSRPLLGTLIPRLDSLNDETAVLNGYIVSLASSKKVALVDNWQAFYNYGDWTSLYRDHLHPDTEGMVVLSTSWYNGIINGIWWLNEETTPPTTWMEPLPAQSPCGQVLVQWNGDDNLSYVAEYDVQTQVSGIWSDWLVATTVTSTTYSSGVYGQSVGFRVRGRDVVGNQSDYSAPVYTSISDNTPPADVQVEPLPLAQTPPFQVRWSASDACSQALVFDVEYRVGAAGTWQPWLTGTSATGGTFDPAAPHYGETYYFHLRARDQAGNWSDWSPPAATDLAEFVLSGSSFTVRDEPVARPSVIAVMVLAVEARPGGYRAYVAGPGDYDLAVGRSGFATLPAMHVLSVTADLDNLDFFLPPLDGVVVDGGFEAGAWGNWLPGGSLPPTLGGPAHTGDGAAILGGGGGTSTLGQVLSVPANLSDATLSFLVRLDDDTASSSTLQVQVAGTTISRSLAVMPGGWRHVWLPADAALGQTVTLSFTVSGDPAIRLDEVSLGSARSGGGLGYLPAIQAGQ